MIHDFHAAVQYGRAEPKRVGYRDESYLPEDIDIIHAVARRPYRKYLPSQPLTKLNIDDTVKAVCGLIVRIQYPVGFKPDEDGACKKCATIVRRTRSIRDQNRPPIRYTTETPDTL